MNNYRKRERGQTSLVFVASLVIIMAAFALLVDGGRYLVMRNRARMMADASALSGAGLLDVEKAQEGNFVLDVSEARKYAQSIYDQNYLDKPDWADSVYFDNRFWSCWEFGHLFPGIIRSSIASHFSRVL